ncbi:nucleotide exchange factor SIL1 [Fopius arisanus]|uniref:Nucleotide exchange factor SIL1 n=3 Tax=Fopius arisanus TaxID=64838 RepID=A0A9R1TJF1_9HYME|nr:PREDICTED: nucleotide exchange factor SIL1 [Fopius arisanus]
MKILMILLVVYLFGALGGNCENKSTAFVATTEWQTVRKGQSIPKGLHVRHNLKTKVIQAKLFEDDNDNQENNDDEKIKSLSLHSDAVLHDAANDLVLSIDELKEKLKKIKLETREDADSLAHKEEVKKAFRSYEDIKEDFKALEMNITTDSEILTDIFNKFKNYEKSLASGSLLRSEADAVLQIFNDLEFLLHQIDNAQVFADLGGMEKIISPCLNITNDDVKIEALIILGTSVQSNPKVQLRATNADLVQKLLHTLTVSSKVSLDSRCMFALGALVRQFPAAQKVLIDHGGLELFGKILEDGASQIQVRVMKLITDLSIERENIKNTEDEALRTLKTREYEKTEFEKKLQLHNYCKYLTILITQKYTDDVMPQDFLEVILENLITLSGTCRNEFRDPENSLINTLQKLEGFYENLRQGTGLEDLETWENLYKQILRLKSLVFEVHDEL